jgi:hypothetical protein
LRTLDLTYAPALAAQRIGTLLERELRNARPHFGSQLTKLDRQAGKGDNTSSYFFGYIKPIEPDKIGILLGALAPQGYVSRIDKIEAGACKNIAPYGKHQLIPF